MVADVFEDFQKISSYAPSDILFKFVEAVTVISFIWSCYSINLNSPLKIFVKHSYDGFIEYQIFMMVGLNARFKGTLMRIWKSPYMFMFI